MNVSVEDMKRDPEGLLHRVLDGETFVLVENERPVAEIRPIEQVRRPRPFCPMTSMIRCRKTCCGTVHLPR